MRLHLGRDFLDDSTKIWRCLKAHRAVGKALTEPYEDCQYEHPDLTVACTG
jgi:hypothetical protein